VQGERTVDDRFRSLVGDELLEGQRHQSGVGSLELEADGRRGTSPTSGDWTSHVPCHGE
jgi:hypothetical protein